MINTTIGKYRITRLIGEGGMASVYEGEHESLGTKAAIKILNPVLSANKQIRERFKNEARLMASLDHPNITRVLDYEETDTYLAFAMELLPGEDLSNRIKRNGKLTEKEIVNLFEQTLSALAYAHSLGIVHRDIKPSNLFVLPNGTIKILDFGIAKLFGQGNEMTQTGTQMGTPMYMSPEQVKADKSIDHRSDIYSLGVTIFYAINGQPPYNSDTDSQFAIFTKIVNEALPAFSVQSKFKEVILKACKKNREERFQSCDEWLKALSQTNFKSPAAEKTKMDDGKSGGEKTIVETNAKVASQKSNTAKPVSSNNNKKFLLIALVVVGIVLAAVGYYNFSGKKDSKSKESSNEVTSYNEIAIGNQVWMTENLDVEKFRNGDPIPEAKTNEEWQRAGENGEPAWCYYDNEYGKLYNWHAVNDSRGLAPKGWHVPSDAEWTLLTDYLGGKTIDTNFVENVHDTIVNDSAHLAIAKSYLAKAGTKMKSTNGWLEDGNGTNESGFSGLPGGYRGGYGTFYGIGNDGYWWSSSEYDTNFARYRSLGYGFGDVYRDFSGKEGGFSVRCLRD